MRKPLPKKNSKVAVCFQLNSQIVAKLRDKSYNSGVAMQNIVEQALEEELK